MFWDHLCRARNNGRSTDNVRTDCGFDRSNFRLAGHVDPLKFNRIENEINLRFLLFSCFSCYLSSRCVLQNFDMKSWRHATRAIVYNIRASKQTSSYTFDRPETIRDRAKMNLAGHRDRRLSENYFEPCL